MVGTQTAGILCIRESRSCGHRCGVGGLGEEECRNSPIALTCSVKYKARSLYLEGATPRCYKCFSLISRIMGILNYLLFAFAVLISL